MCVCVCVCLGGGGGGLIFHLHVGCCIKNNPQQITCDNQTKIAYITLQSNHIIAASKHYSSSEDDSKRFNEK